jgi:LysM repeat protein
MRYTTYLVILIGIILAGCSANSGIAETPSVLTPFATRTAGIPTIQSAVPTLDLPPTSVIPTQITHVVKKGEDMGGIATQYGVKIKDLRAANAEIDPRMIPVGTVLIIPSGNPEQDTNRPTAIPTPGMLLLTGSPVCYADPSGGAWCLVKVENTTGSAVQDISVDIVLAKSAGSDPQTRAAFALNDRLPAGSSITLSTYFPDAPAQPWQVGSRLRTASPVIAEDEHFLLNNLDGSSTEIATDRLSAHISGIVQLQANQKDANIIQVTASAYDATGQPIGVRRWSSPVGLESGSGLVYDLNIYSLGGPIDHIDVLAETRP